LCERLGVRNAFTAANRVVLHSLPPGPEEHRMSELLMVIAAQVIAAALVALVAELVRRAFRTA